jgi:hypothetical protein
MVPDMVDLQPTITPVLDVSQLRNSATGLDSIFGSRSLSVGASVTSASLAASAINKVQEGYTGTGSDSEVSSAITFVQNNLSPKALSEAEIYRQTNNQLSKLKGALNI